jgi:hypothetical protein
VRKPKHPDVAQGSVRSVEARESHVQLVTSGPLEEESEDLDALALEASASSALTAILVHQYLQTHRPNRDRPCLDFLVTIPDRTMWLVRWPSGSVKWETAVSLAARGFSLPPAPLIEQGAFVDPAVAREVDAALERR